MDFEYGVMKQVGIGIPTVVADGYATFEDAEKACNKLWNNIDDRQGITVFTAAEAARVARQFAENNVTRFYVVRRPVGEWEEAYE